MIINKFALNKCRFIWLYYQYLTFNGFFKTITIYYPIPGHSYLLCDRYFALIKKIRHKTDKICVPLDFVNIVEKANIENPFKVIFANYPLTNDLSLDNHEVVKVMDYKNIMKEYIKPSLDHLT